MGADKINLGAATWVRFGINLGPDATAHFINLGAAVINLGTSTWEHQPECARAPTLSGILTGAESPLSARRRKNYIFALLTRAGQRSLAAK